MREHRIFSNASLQPGSTVELDANAARHLVKALRLKPGDALVLFDGSGDDYAATLSEVNKKKCRAHVGERLHSESQAALKLHLAIGISRGERMDFSVQKAVELGVNEISPLFTERSMVQLKGERLHNRLAHWHGIVRHACEQSGRSRLPHVNAPCTLQQWLAANHHPGVLLDHRAADSLPSLPTPTDSLSLLVGPEGGLSAQERRQALLHGLKSARIGPRILRTETAPLAALAVIQALWGDFR